MYSSKTFKNGDSGLTRTLRRPFLTTRSERRSGVSAFLLGSNVWPLLDESTPIVPEAVMQSQGVLQVIIFQSPRFRIYPLIRGKSENELNVGSRRAGPTIASYKPWKSRIRKILKKRANFFQLVSDLFCVVKRGFIEPCKNVLCNKLPYIGWISADFWRGVLSPKIFARPVPTYVPVIDLRFPWLQRQRCKNVHFACK
jgi:hypothetical protein